MKTLKTLFLLGVMICYVGCKDAAADQSGDVQVQVGPSNVSILPATLATCVQVVSNNATAPALAANTMQLSLKLQWAGSLPLTIDYIQVVLDSGAFTSGKFVVIFNGDELNAILGLGGTQPVINPPPAPVPPATAVTPTTVTAACAMRVGNIAFADKHADASGTGTISIIGHTTDPTTGDGDTVITQQFVNFHYTGLP